MEVGKKKLKFCILKINIIEKTHNYAQKHAITYGIFHEFFCFFFLLFMLYNTN